MTYVEEVHGGQEVIVDSGKRHQKAQLIGIILLVVTFALTATFNALAGALGGEIPLFNNNVGNISDKYDTFITPAGWTFSIWSVIYLWIAILLAFYMLSLCLTSKTGGKLYLNPPVASVSYLAVFILNLLFNLAWIFIWDREWLIPASVLLFLIAVTNIIALAILSYNMARDNQRLKSEQPAIYWTYVFVGQNAHATYTTWTVVASFLNLYIALFYEGEVDGKTCAYISLGCVLTSAVLWFILENVFLDNYVRFIFTPYAVLVWASAGIISAKDHRDDVPDEVKTFTRAICGIAGAFLLLRIIIIIWRVKKFPFPSHFPFLK